MLAKEVRTEASGSVLHFFQGSVFGAKKVRTDPDADAASFPPSLTHYNVPSIFVVRKGLPGICFSGCER